MKLLAVVAMLAGISLLGQATGNTTIQPDIIIPFTFTATGTFPATTVSGGPEDNRQKGCAAWTMMYQSTGFSGVSIQLNSGASPTTTVSYGAFAGTISMGFSNPLTSTTGGSLQATNGTAAISWVQVAATLTGTGTVNGVLYCFRNSSAAVNGGGGGGGSFSWSGGSAGTVCFYVDATHCNGSSGLTFSSGIFSVGSVLSVGDVGASNTNYISMFPSTFDPLASPFSIAGFSMDISATPTGNVSAALTPSGAVWEVDLNGTFNYGNGSSGFNSLVNLNGSGNYGLTQASKLFAQQHDGHSSRIDVNWLWFGAYGGTTDLVNLSYAAVPTGGNPITTLIGYYAEDFSG